MSNKYLNFISDNHLLDCIAKLHSSYVKAKTELTLDKFYKNKIDIIKAAFDSSFNGLDEESLVKTEIIRQVDKSINNAIGEFHENILGGIKGFEVGNLSGYDIKASDNTLFADIKNKHNTMNSSAADALFTKLSDYADRHRDAKCYWVQIWAKGSFCEPWIGIINRKERQHSRVFKISGDRFYGLLTGNEKALFQLYDVLPTAINDFLNSLNNDNNVGSETNDIFSAISSKSSDNNRSLFHQIAVDNFEYYKGFEEL